MAAGRHLAVQRLATGWTVRGSKPCAGEIFFARPGRSRILLSFMYISKWVSFSALKRRGRRIDHSLPSNSEDVNEQRNVPAHSSDLYDMLQAKR